MQGIGSMHRSYKKLLDTNTVSVVCVRADTQEAIDKMNKTAKL